MKIVTDQLDVNWVVDQIREVLEGQEFADWYSDDGRFGHYTMGGNDPRISKEEINRDIRKMFLGIADKPELPFPMNAEQQEAWNSIPKTQRDIISTAFNKDQECLECGLSFTECNASDLGVCSQSGGYKRF